MSVVDRPPLPDTVIRDVDANPSASPEELDGWLAGGAADLAAALTQVGPDAVVWTPVPGCAEAAFYARRFAHETLVHWADAFLAVSAAGSRPRPTSPSTPSTSGWSSAPCRFCSSSFRSGGHSSVRGGPCTCTPPTLPRRRTRSGWWT